MSKYSKGFSELISEEIYERPFGLVTLGYLVLFALLLASAIERGVFVYQNWDFIRERAETRITRLGDRVTVWLKNPKFAIERVGERVLRPWLIDETIQVQDSKAQLRSWLSQLPDPKPIPPPRTEVAALPVEDTDFDWSVSEIEAGFFDRDHVLSDPEDRVRPDFKVPARLLKRTQFWFDIYAKYPSSSYLIHHAKYPWIIFEIVDTSEFFKSDIADWRKRFLAERLVAKRRAIVLQKLLKLKKYGTPNPDDMLEVTIAQKLSQIGGPRRRVYAEAVQEMRVQLGQKDFFLSGLANSAKYLPFMEQEFVNVDLPPELSRIPFVESSFNEKAQSKVGASGIWQIMPQTARGLLKMTDSIDERNSPLKATRLAANYLKRDFNYFKSWPLAITAYNHGIGSLDHAIKQLGTLDIQDIIDRYRAKSFGFASKNFFACFLAALHAEKYRDKLFGQVISAPLLDKVYYELPRAVSARKLPSLMGISEEEFLFYNLDILRAYRSNTRIPKGFQIFVPRRLVESIEVRLAVARKT